MRTSCLTSFCRRHRGAAVIAFMFIVSMLGATNAQLAITLDESVTHQTIEGFGSMLKRDVGPTDQQDISTQSHREFLINDFGFTVFRPWLPMTGFEPTNDNGDPNTLNMSGFVINNQMQFVIDMINYLKGYPDVKFIPAILSPPSWMKTNNSEVDGGNLRDDMREELAEFMVACYRVIKQETGVDLYGMSIQNEPAFAEFYGSCVYSADQYIEAFKVVAARFEAEEIDTKLYGAEDMLTNLVVTPYIGRLNMDADCKPYLDAIAVHGYSDGVNPMPTSGAAQKWDILGRMSRSMNKPAWMSEGAGWESTDAMSPAMHIGMALKYADLSLWVYLAQNDCDVWGLLCNRQHTKRSAACKHYYRYLRPGAVRIDANYTDDAEVLANAFVHTENQTLTVVLVNNGDGARDISLAGDNLPATMHKYITVDSRLCEADGDVSTSGAITLAAKSVITLQADNHVTAVHDPIDTPRRQAATLRRAPGSALGSAYLIDGSRASGTVSAAGVLVTEGRVIVEGIAASPSMR